MNRNSPSEIVFQAYRLVLVTLTMIAVIRFICDYDWAQSSLYGISTIFSFFVGQAIVSVLQNRQRTQRETVRRESDWS